MRWLARSFFATLPLLLPFVGQIPISFANAAEFQVPALTGPVMDLANLMDSNSRAELERLYRDELSNSGIQFTVLTVPDMGGLTIEEASIKTVDAWKLGRKGEDLGVLIMIAVAERKVRIEVGRGLEGVLTDAMTKRILDRILIPSLRSQQVGPGVLQASQVMIEMVHGQPSNETSTIQDAPPRRKRSGFFNVLFFILFLIFFFFRSLFRPRRRSFWGGGGWGGGSWGGGGWSGSSGGGGWSGGGGGFSGGGSSGSW